MNKIFDLLYQLFLKSNVFMAICSGAFFYSGMMIISHRIPHNEYVIPSFLFFSTLLVYNISQKRLVLPGKSFFSNKSQWRSTSIILLLSAILGVHFFFLEYKVILFLLHLGVISLLYNIPYLNDTKLLPLRGIPLIKVFLIGYVWASIGAVLPAIVLGTGFQGFMVWQFLCKFAFIVGITLPFDIRDFYRDRESQLITIPRLIGVKKTKIFSAILLLISVLLQSFIIENYVVLLMNAIALWLIFNASAEKRNYYYLLFLDGTIILFMIMIWLDELVL